jgi:hypothetical protein
MTPYSQILAVFTRLITYADSWEEQWHHLSIHGTLHPGFLDEYKQLPEQLRALGFSTVLRLYFNNNEADDNDIDDYSKNPESIGQWEVRLNKWPLIQKVHSDSWHYNFFLTSEKCEQWLKELNPLLKSCPINELGQIRILVGDLQESFGGESVQFLPGIGAYVVPASSNYQLPSPDQLKEVIHFITTDDISINAAAWKVTFRQATTPLQQAFRYQACVALATCLVTEYHNDDKVIVNGIRRIVLRIFDGHELLTDRFYIELLGLVAWIFEDRVPIRKKLFNERLSLDQNPGDTLLKSLINCLPHALEQAKERYNFVIIDRKDAYVKELKELLKDIRTQSELYAVKIRTLLSNFLRDLLAGLVLVGFTLFTKFTDQDTLSDNHRLKLVFYALAIYFIASIILQAIVDWTDISVSKKEMLYWKNASKELLPEKDFDRHIKNSLTGRRRSLRIIYPIVAVFYVGIAFTCFYFPDIYDHWFKK